jgi:hypothetical protein
MLSFSKSALRKGEVEPKTSILIIFPADHYNSVNCNQAEDTI